MNPFIISLNVFLCENDSMEAAKTRLMLLFAICYLCTVSVMGLVPVCWHLTFTFTIEVLAHFLHVAYFLVAVLCGQSSTQVNTRK